MFCLLNFFLNISNMFLFLQSNSPVIMVITIMIQGLSLISISNLLWESPWIMMVIFLVYMGGVMMLLIYVSSFTSRSILITRFLNPEIFIIMLIMIILYTYKFFLSYSNQSFWSQVFFFNKDFFFMYLITLVILFVFLINNLTSSVDSPVSKML